MPLDDIPRAGPENIEAEQSLLGAILINNAAYHRVQEFLAAEHFAKLVHARIYAAVGSLVQQGTVANPITLKNLFEKDASLSNLGGWQYLVRLAESAVTVINAPHYAESIVKAARLRFVIESCQATIDRALAADLQVSADDIIAEHREQLAIISGGSIDTLKPFNPTELDGAQIPDRPWLVPGWIPMARVTGLYGAGGEGKTLLGQMLATSCAIGEQWIGLPVLKCRSLLCFCEDDRDEMQRRQDEINRAYRCGFSDLDGMRWLPRLGDENALMEFPDGRPRPTPLFRQLLRTAREQRAKLIIVDTLADVFLGNENDRAQARAFAQQALGLLARETQGAVVALAHPSLNGINSGSGQSGSTAWVGTFRSQLHLTTPKPEDKTEPPDPDLRVLARKKSNAARRDDEIRLRWEDGAFVSLSTPASDDFEAYIQRQVCEQRFLELLRATDKVGRRLSDSDRAGNYAPRAFARHPKRGDFKQRDFVTAMESLFAADRIGMAGDGRNRRLIEVRGVS